MQDLILKTFTLGDLATNSYLIINKADKKAFIIDAPPENQELLAYIKKEGLIVDFIILTHGHFDHIGGLNDLNFSFYIHELDAAFLKNDQLNFSTFISGYPYTVEKSPQLLKDNQIIKFGKYDLKIIHTPGHTPGGISIQLGFWLFSGDTLFFHSVGRTDIPLASSQIILESIKNNLFLLPDNTVVYPGHGGQTTIGIEKQENQFLI